MGFSGSQLNQCRQFHFHSSQIEIIILPGNLNLCGHVMLKAKIIEHNSKVVDYYFHVPGLSLDAPIKSFTYHPHYLIGESEFQTYLITNNKDVKKMFRIEHHLNPLEQAQVSKKLSLLMEKPWYYKIILDNCQTFIEEVLQDTVAELKDKTSWVDCPTYDFDQPGYENVYHINHIDISIKNAAIAIDKLSEINRRVIYAITNFKIF